MVPEDFVSILMRFLPETALQEPKTEGVSRKRLGTFNAQDYARALTEKNRAEDITRVLYPNDSTWEGKRLRIDEMEVTQ